MSTIISLDTIREAAARQRHERRVAPIHRVARAPLPTLTEQIEAHAPTDSFHRSLDSALTRQQTCSCGDAA